MTKRFQLTLLAVLTAASTWALAQSTAGNPAAQPPTEHAQMHAQMHGASASGDQHPMHAAMQDPGRAQRMAKRQAVFKAQLRLTPEQEGAWNALITALQASRAPLHVERPDALALAQLSTPERLDKLQAIRAQHMGAMSAAMAQRSQAVKTFYAVLAPDQQKVFDALSLQMLGRLMGPMGHRGGPGNHGEPGHHGAPGHHNG